jgi:hypothetical protein
MFFLLYLVILGNDFLSKNYQTECNGRNCDLAVACCRKDDGRD